MAATDPPKPPTKPAKRSTGRLGRRLALWLGIPFAVLLVVLLLGVPVPLVLLERPIERAASEALGREVRTGGLQLELGVRPALAIDDLRIAHGVEGRPDLLRAERLELELGMLALLDQRLRIRRAEARNVTLRTDPEAFPEDPAAEGAEEAPGELETELEDADLTGWGVDVDHLSVENVQAEIHRPDVAPKTLQLDELSGRLTWRESLELELSGRYEELAVAARVEGGPVAELLAGARNWPLHLAIDLGGTPVAFEAKLASIGGVYRMDDLKGRSDRTTLNGWLALENLASKPRASGSIQLDSIEFAVRGEPDPAPAPGPEGDEGTKEESDFAELLAGRPVPERERPGPIVALVTLLDDYETDLELGIARISGLGPVVEDLSVALRLKGGELRFPVSLKADGIPLSGTLALDEREGTPRLGFRLAAQDFRVDELADTLKPEAHIAGPFRKLEVEVEGSGYSARSFLVTLSIHLVAVDAELSYGAARPVPFIVDLLEVSREERGPHSIEVRGELLGEAVQLDLSGGTVEDLITERPWTLELGASGAGAELTLKGEAIGFLAEAQLLADVHIHGERLSSLEPWIGALPVPDAPYTIRLEVDDLPERGQVTLEEVSLGATKLMGELGERREDGARLLWAKLRIESLDLTPYVEAARQGAADAPPAGDDEPGFGFDAPILPGGVEVQDADLDIAIGSLVIGDLELENLMVRGAFRDGFLPDSAFALEIGGARFEGAASIDLREPPHGAIFRFGTRDVDVGRLLASLGLARGLDARAGSLSIEAEGEGSTFGDILRTSDVTARLANLRWTLRDPNSDATLRFALERGELRSPTGDEPVRFTARGALDGTPVTLSLQTKQLSFFERPEERVPLDIELEMAGATLSATSTAAFPIERADLELALELEGRSLADASSLLEYELPPIGPYRLSSTLHLTPKDYRIESFELEVGRSRLRGAGSLDTRGKRPRVELDLESQRLQLDDFAAAWEEDPDAAPEGAAPAQPTPAGGDEPLEFMSPEGLLGLDGRLDLRVAQVVSGEDELGRGRVTATLENGRLEVEPLHIELPGGPLDFRLGYAYMGQEVAARVRAHTEQFDYGVLARRVDPETEMGGWLSLDLDIEGQAPENSQLLAHSSGHIDFLAKPLDFETDVFDLWAVSLLNLLLPRLDEGPRSTLNCIVARFDLQDGLLEEKVLMLDTTRMVVKGDASVDFREERVKGRLEPAPKKATVLSLQTAVTVDGSFEDFDVGVPPEEIVETIVRFVTGVVIAPIRRVIEGGLPADGEEACRAAWRDERPQ